MQKLLMSALAAMLLAGCGISLQPSQPLPHTDLLALGASTETSKQAAAKYLEATDKAFHRDVTEQALLSIAFSRLGTSEAKQKASKWLQSAEKEMSTPNNSVAKDGLSGPMLALAYLMMKGRE